jgi:predicted PurR-regulated permease PerM
MKTRPSTTDSTIALVVLAVLIVGVYLVIQPFLTAIVWAAVLAASTWPVFSWLRKRLGNRSAFAATLATLLTPLVVVSPFLIVGGRSPRTSTGCRHTCAESSKSDRRNPRRG